MARGAPNHRPPSSWTTSSSWQMLDRLPAEARAKDIARAEVYAALRERLPCDPDPDPRALAALA